MMALATDRMELFLAWLRQILGWDGPKWDTYPARRQSSAPGVVLPDISSRTLRRDPSSDPVTKGHEKTHYINSEMRMHFRTAYPGKRINAFYCLDGRAAVIEEPNTTIRTAAALVPRSLRGKVYWYMTSTLLPATAGDDEAGVYAPAIFARYYLPGFASMTAKAIEESWNGTPLYILDEYVAYANGSEVRRDLKLWNRLGTVAFMVEFIAYALAICWAASKVSGYDATQLKAWYRWNTERAIGLQRDEMARGGNEGASYLRLLKEQSDAAHLRQFARGYLGDAWCEKWLFSAG